MMRPTTLITAFLMSGLMACGQDDDDRFGSIWNSGSGGNDDTGRTGWTDDTGSGGEEGGEDSGAPMDDTGGGKQYFDEPGDTITFEDADGDAEVPLEDIGGETNQDQEFYLVIINSGESGLGYNLAYGAPSPDEPDDTGLSDSGFPGEGGEGGKKGGGEGGGGEGGGGEGGGEGGGGGGGGEGGEGPPSASMASGTRDLLTPARKKLRDAKAAGRIDTVETDPSAPPPPSLEIGFSRSEYRVRDSMDDDESYDYITATLWSTGSSVNIWVDVNVPIDWDFDCDGVIDVEAAGDAYGFDNCDLELVADIVDTNLVSTLNTYFGEVSDVNGDGVVNVVVTPVMNGLTQGQESSDGTVSIIGGYADPEVDLNDRDSQENPGSDEEEVIYVFAPDPYGFYNNKAKVTLDQYTDMEVAGQIARSYQRLISYNQHVLVSEGDVEETWVTEGLSALAADLCGFGAVYHEAVWDYVDSSHLQPLVVTTEVGAISSSTDWGAQYLFLRWVIDVYGVDVVANMIQTASVGYENIQEAVYEASDGLTFDELVLKFHVAMFTTGLTDSDGEALLDTDTWPPFVAASFVEAPTSSPADGDLYGANGYQQGINMGGFNYYMENGTSEEATEVDGKTVLLGNSEHQTMVYGIDFYGYVGGNYAGQIVRLVDVPLDLAAVKIQAAGSGYSGVVIRASDPDMDDLDYAVEQGVFSATESTSLTLPLLPDDGSKIYGLGTISDSALTSMVDSDGAESDTTVYDTDRWLLDLTDRDEDDSIRVSIRIDRHWENLNGDIAPYDIWFAVLDSSLVPTPTVDGTQRGECSEGGVDFGYPSLVLDYLFHQIFLSPDAYGDVTDVSYASTYQIDSGGTGFSIEDYLSIDDGFDPCGIILGGGSTTCDADWDRDGVLDAFEPEPENFLQQVQVTQCTLAGNDIYAFEAVGTEIFDWDSVDEDEESYTDRERNLGGKTGEAGEEAYYEVDLTGGIEYLIVVGAATDTGAYELSVRQIDDVDDEEGEEQEFEDE